MPAEVDEEIMTGGLNPQIREEHYRGFDPQSLHEVADKNQVQVDEAMESRCQGDLPNRHVLSEPRCVPVGMPQGVQEFGRPSPLVAYANVLNALKTQSFFPHRYCDPQGALRTLEPIARDPGGAAWKLDRVQEHEHVCKRGLGEESGKGGEVGLVGCQNHSY